MLHASSQEHLPKEPNTGSSGPYWSIIVGIGRYPDGTKNSTALHDIAALKSLLVKKYRIPESKIFILTDHDATLSNILNALETVKMKIQSDEQLLFFYSGKGDVRSAVNGGEKYPYIIPFDTTADPIYEIGLSVPVLVERIVDLPIDGAMLIFNAPIGGASVISEQLRLKDKFPLNQALPSVGILMSGLYDRKLQGNSADTISAFMQHLIHGVTEGDANSDSVLTSMEWSRYVTNEISSSTQLRQNPQYASYPRLKPNGAQLREPEQFMNQRLITSETRGAIVFNGLQLLGRTPLMVRFSGERATYTVTATGYSAMSVTVDAQWSPETVAVRLSPATRLRVTTNPPGASIFLNDSLVGTTPFFEPKLPRSRYRMRLWMHQFLEVDSEIDLTDSVQMDVNERLERKVGFLTLSGYSGSADISLKGSAATLRMHRLPVRSMNVAQDRYELSITKPGYHSFVTTVDVGDQSVTIPVQMDPTSRPFSIALSTVIAGSGQLYSGRPLIGWPLLGGFIYTVGKAASYYSAYNAANDDYTRYRTAYQNSGIPSEMDSYYGSMNTSYNEMKKNQKNFILFSGIAGVLTAVSVIDAVVFEPAPWETEGITVRVTIP